MCTYMKILYLYSGTRKNKWQGIPGIDFPDTQLYGLNHLHAFGVTAEHKELSDFLPKWLVRLVPFRVRHVLLYLATKHYDIVFGSSLIYLLVLQKVFKRKTRFVLLNISLFRTVVANKYRRLRFAFLTALLKELSVIVCLADTQKELIEKELPFLKGKVHVVPLGVDTIYHKPVYKGRKNYILSAGRDNGRDYKTVIETARSMPGRVFHIVCSKRNLVGISNIPKNVKIFFDLPPNELYKKYREARVLLMVTHDDQHQDGSDCSGQTVLLEAMASGVPVVVSRKKYITEYIKEGEEALLVDFYNKEEVAEKIKTLDNDMLRDSLSKNARARVERDFSTTRMAENLASVFNEIK